MKKFEESDIFYNSIKTHPKVSFFGYSGSIFYNNTNETVVKINDFLLLPSGTGVVIDNAFLTEDGNFLITESGDYILIE